jgi:hypothetical protein
MDHGQFDALTRTVGDGGTRRAVVRLLAVATLGGFVARLGLADVTAAKGKKHKAKSKRQRKSQAERKAQGQLQAAGKHKGKKRHKKPKPPPVPDPPCPDGKGLCPDGKTCVYIDECCPGQDRCADGTCVEQDQCCPGQRDCGGGVCVGPNRCCPAEKKCADGECYPKDGCCPEEKLCDSETCIPQTECCELTAPLCDECEEEFCDNGTWSCRPTTGVDACQACPAGSEFCGSVVGSDGWDWFDLPPGCCPADRYFPDQWWGTGKYLCAQPEGPGSVWAQCD